jgi:hypothetical protein
MRSSSASVRGEQVAEDLAAAVLGVVGIGAEPRSMIFAYPTFHRAVDSALWSPPRSAAKMAGA